MAADSHHRRKGHARNTATGDVVPVRETRVKNRGRNTSTEPRKISNREGLIGIAEHNSDDDIDADDVIFALESPEWSSLGFRRADAAPWIKQGIDPDNAKVWNGAGYDPEFADEWRTSNNPRAPRVPATDALRYLAEGVDYFEAMFWVGGKFTVDEGIAWAKMIAHPSDVNLWHDLGVTHPDDIAPYRAIGFDDPMEVKYAQEMRHDVAHEWLKAGVTLKEGRKWMDVVEGGYPVSRVAAIVNHPKTGQEKGKLGWIESGIPIGQITQYIEKGYGPRAAKTQFNKGITADKAPDLKGNEPVPGKAWSGLKDAFAEKAKAENRDVKVTSRDVSGSAKKVTVTLTDTSDPTVSSTYELFFTHTGGFLEGRSDVKRKTRAVSSAAAFRRLHFDV